ncbi:hypothetical protein D3C80_964580 [compost metagenome]
MLGLAQGQLEHSQQGIHGRADFMAHGGQEGGLGPVRRLGFFLGQLHRIVQTLAFGNVDPAGNDASDRAVAATIGQ